MGGVGEGGSLEGCFDIGFAGYLGYWGVAGFDGADFADFVDFAESEFDFELFVDSDTVFVSCGPH
jgi:hypothetical protein